MGLGFGLGFGLGLGLGSACSTRMVFGLTEGSQGYLLRVRRLGLGG